MQDYARNIRVTYDSDNKIYEVGFTDCSVVTEADACAFFEAIAKRLAGLPPPRDLVFCLEGVEIGPDARPAYGRERARVARAYYRHSARYAGRSAVKVTVMTSGVVHRIEGMVYETREQAVAAIAAMRKAAGD